MLYIIYGSNRDKIKQKQAALVAALLKKRPESFVVKYNQDNWDAENLRGSVAEQALFSSKYVIVLDSIFQNKEFKSDLLEMLPLIKDSEHICLLVEESLTKKDLEILTKFSEKIEEHNNQDTNQGGYKGRVKISGEEASKKAFACASYLAEKKNALAWIKYIEIKEILAPEELHGIIWWQFKSLVLANVSKNATEAGLSPYAFTSSKSKVKIWTNEDLTKKLDELVGLYHEGHRGKVDFAVGLERFILSSGH